MPCSVSAGLEGWEEGERGTTTTKAGSRVGMKVIPFCLCTEFFSFLSIQRTTNFLCFSETILPRLGLKEGGQGRFRLVLLLFNLGGAR